MHVRALLAARVPLILKVNVMKMPADGTTAATVWNGDFGASPFFGQLWGKSLLAYQ
jgi:hypothetical protein